MYYVTTIKDSVSIPPKYIGEDATKAAADMLRNKYERTVDKDLGIMLVVYNIRDISEGFILPEDPNAHHDVTFDVLSFKLDVDEVVVGEASEFADFGVYVRIGPLDGLVHLSQVTNDFVSFDRKSGMLVSKSLKRSLKKGDTVYAKVSTVSTRGNGTKVALTMRPEGLGKLDWIKEERIKGLRAAKGKRR